MSIQNKKEAIFIPCECDCASLMICKYPDGDYGVSIVDSYYQNTSSVRARIKAAFKVLFGKPVYFNDLVLYEESFKALIKDLEKLKDTPIE